MKSAASGQPSTKFALKAGEYSKALWPYAGGTRNESESAESPAVSPSLKASGGGSAIAGASVCETASVAASASPTAPKAGSASEAYAAAGASNASVNGCEGPGLPSVDWFS